MSIKQLCLISKLEENNFSFIQFDYIHLIDIYVLNAFYM